MMQATLMNFGDNTRVVYDIHNKPTAIDIGQVVEIDIADVHFHMIKRALATDTLMVVPKESRMSRKLQEILEILKAIETEPYDALLQKFNAVAQEVREEHADVAVQPPRHVIRRLLRDLAKYEVAKSLGMTSKVVIHEQGDEVTRNRDEGQLRERSPEVEDPTPPAPAPAPAPEPEPEAAQPVKKARPRKKTAPKRAAGTIKRERL